MEPAQSDEFDGNSIAKAVLAGITEEDFSSSAVDALLAMVHAGHNDVLGDVLAYLANHQQPDWAAELCRMVMAGPDGAAEDRDFATVAEALAQMVQSSPVALARKVCTYILQVKDNGQGGSFFDCYDISLTLGHMVQANAAPAAGQILYDLYCDDSDQGRMYQSLVPHVLGTLIDKDHAAWAVELSKQLMYEDGERSIDYTVMGWALAQMVYCGRQDWAAAICDGILSQHLRWYNQGLMMRGVAAWGDQAYTQAIQRAMTSQSPNSSPRGHYQQHYQHGGRGNNAARNVISPRGGPAAQQPAPTANGNHAGLQTALEGLKVSDNGPSTPSPATPPLAAEPAGAPSAQSPAAGSPLVPSAPAFVPSAPRSETAS